jgi:chemotaxis protein CheD
MENVRMGEMVVSSLDGDELVAIGLGSCIGLALADRQSGVAGLAHIVLPDSQGAEGPPGKYADLAVPEMIRLLEGAGAVKRRLQAVLIGGARMFSLGASLDIGARNAAAVRAELERVRVTIHAEEIGGSRGRTARVFVGQCVTSQLAGGERTSLLDLARPSSRAAAAVVRPGFAGARP